MPALRQEIPREEEAGRRSRSARPCRPACRECCPAPRESRKISRTAPANGLLFSKLERRDMRIEVREALELAPGRSLKKELSGTIRLAGEQGYLTGT